jgi:alpha-methylacyl-CoA racemase
MAGPLEGLRVVELGGIGPVPHAGMVLADLGAEVVQVSRPGMVEDVRTRTDILNRGKLSMAVDLKAEAGRDLILRLLEDSDVLIEGFRPGVAERLGLGPEQCLGANPAWCTAA